MRLVWRDVYPAGGPQAGPPINTSITEAETGKLQLLAAGVDALEIGSAYGYSAIVMALAGATSVACIDPHITHASYERFWANATAYGVGARMQVHIGRSQDHLPALAASDPPARLGLIFIDGDHTAEVVEHDVTWALQLLTPGGALACHDYDEDTCPGVRVALDRLFGGPGELTDTLAVYRP